MNKKRFFWQRKRDYYEFPVWMQVVAWIWRIAWTGVKIVGGAALAALAVACIAGGIFACQLAGYLQEDVIPNATFDLSSFRLDQSSFIYYLDSQNHIVQMEEIDADVSSVWVDYEEIPQDLIHAAVAIEDKRFFQHQGVDWVTTTKACLNMFLGGSSTFGGSTITQQLIKNLTQEDDVTVRRKIQEIFRAIQFESMYDKETILEWYMNKIYLGEGCQGVRSAAKVYFGKDVSELSTAECASLISITNNPSLYDPYYSFARNQKRQRLVLSEMHKQGYLTDAEYEQALDERLVITNSYKNNVTCPNCGFEGSKYVYDYVRAEDTYYCPSCGAAVAVEENNEETTSGYSYFTDQVITDVVHAFMEQTGYDWKTCLTMVQKGGFHIYSTINMDIQNLVDSIYTDLSQIPTVDSVNQLQSAIVIIDNRTGDVVAMAGGVGEKTGYLDWNIATDSTLQVGSSIKPLTVYAPALEAGVITPGSMFFDGPWSDGYPQNYDRTYDGANLILEGVNNSLNTAAIRTLDEIGLDYSYDFAVNKFGLDTLVEGDMDYSPLGMGAFTYGCRVWDIAEAYATFANHGVWREARSFTRVLDSDGNVVLENEQDSRQILTERTVNYMNYMLNYAVNNGTATPASFGGMEIAGKTGTTSNNQDQWFAGYTAYYTAVVWSGFAQPEQIRPTGPERTNPSSRLWKKVMEPLHEDLEFRDIWSTSGMQKVELCTESGLLATDACRADPRGSCAKSVYLYWDDVPKDSCNAHVMMSYCEEGHALASEYCAKFPGVKLTQKGLVKLTEKTQKLYEEAEIDWKKFGFLESSNGKDLETCQIHTKAAWEKENDKPKPTTPVTPVLPTEPTKPNPAR